MFELLLILFLGPIFIAVALGVLSALLGPLVLGIALPFQYIAHLIQTRKG